MRIERKINIRYAGNDYFEWLYDNDGHISENVLKNKIENNEIIIAENNNCTSIEIS